MRNFTRGRIVFALLVFVCVGGIAIAQNVSNYIEQGGARTVIGGSLDVVSGGDLDIESGASLKTAGSAVTWMQDKFVLCGQLVDAGSVQTWVGPSVATYMGGGGDTTIGGTICNALDSETSSAAADAPIDADFPAFGITGMQCIVSSDPTNDVAIVLHSAAAVLTPTVTCTIAGSGSAQGCSATTSTTTDVAAGATISAEINYTEDLDAQDVWCQVYMELR